MEASSPISSQQFCLRWHNHQASLLSSLPLLLDQSHLTDVTLSAEGRTVRAHRVVLSACSSFFSELFRTLEAPYHPVVVLPGTSFGALVALLTFMYSGEVNVFEDQISILLTLAETLGIKGLADFNGNITKSPKSSTPTSIKEFSIPSSPILSAHQHKSSTYENIFNKSFQFYPSQISQQPLNFSQSSSRKCPSNENNQTNRSNGKNGGGGLFLESRVNNENSNLISNLSNNNHNHNSNDVSDELKIKTGMNSSNENNFKKSRNSDMRKIDKIAENLRCATTNKNFMEQNIKHPLILPQTPPTSAVLKPPGLPALPHNFLTDDNMNIPKTPESLFLDGNHNLNQTMQTAEILMNINDIKTEKINQTGGGGGVPNSPISKTANSKLYATCYICHKQLSNQYNLRVHLETHQNVRYACAVCTHVSRSKDALRKHVSYRHPGTPSTCDSDTRRKRNKNFNHSIKQEIMDQTANALQQIIAASPLKTINQNQEHQKSISGINQLNSPTSSNQFTNFIQQNSGNITVTPSPPMVNQTNSLDELNKNEIGLNQ